MNAVTKLFIGMLLLGATTVGVPATASAHSYGHKCVGKTDDVLTSGFGCRVRHAYHESYNYLWLAREISGYYNKSYASRPRATVHVAVRSNSSQKSLRVCDWNANDSIRARLRIELRSGSYIDRYAPQYGCYETLTTSATSAIRRFRLVFNTPTGAVSHGTQWYSPPPYFS